MGEGAAVFLLKRLADAERDGDRIYAVVRAVAGSSDGKGKGITAPNPVGQRLCVERAWESAGLSPATAGYVEGHGTSTRVGDVVEVEALGAVFGAAGAAPGSIRLGSVKSNIGHLKGAAAAAGVLKATLALHHKVVPPSIHAEQPNPNIDFSRSPFVVNKELREWDTSDDTPRRAGVSVFGFGGTNFHVVLEEYVPGRNGGNGNGHAAVAVGAALPATDRAVGAGDHGADNGTAGDGTGRDRTAGDRAGDHAARDRAGRDRTGGRGRRREGAAARRARIGAGSDRELAARLRGSRCRRRSRECAGTRRTGRRRSRRGRAGRDRLRRRRGTRDEGHQGARSARVRRAADVARAARRKVCSSAAARQARSRSSTPGRARSTSTCSRRCASRSPSSPRRSPKPTP